MKHKDETQMECTGKSFFKTVKNLKVYRASQWCELHKYRNEYDVLHILLLKLTQQCLGSKKQLHLGFAPWSTLTWRLPLPPV